MSLLRKVCPGGDFYFSRGDHNIGHEMVLRGEMSSFLQWVASGCENAPPAGVMRAYEPLFEVPQHLLEEGLHGVGQRAWEARFSEFPVEELPIFLLEHKVQQLLSENSALCHYPCPLFTSIGPNWIRHYLGAGWYAPDQSGVWSQGLLHQLRGGLVEFGTPECRYAIRFDVELYPDDRDDEPLYLEFFPGAAAVQARCARSKTEGCSVFGALVRGCKRVTSTCSSARRSPRCLQPGESRKTAGKSRSI